MWIYSFHQVWKIFGHDLLKYLFCSSLSFRDCNTLSIRLLEVLQLTDALSIFSQSLLSLCFILDGFHCYLFKFLNLCFCDI